MERIQKIIGEGSIKRIGKNTNEYVYRITKKHLRCFNTLIPFFTKYPLYGTKLLDFKEALTELIDIMESGRNLTIEGIKEIDQIMSGMNTKRYS